MLYCCLMFPLMSDCMYLCISAFLHLGIYLCGFVVCIVCLDGWIAGLLDASIVYVCACVDDGWMERWMDRWKDGWRGENETT